MVCGGPTEAVMQVSVRPKWRLRATPSMLPAKLAFCGFLVSLVWLIVLATQLHDDFPARWNAVRTGMTSRDVLNRVGTPDHEIHRRLLFMELPNIWQYERRDVNGKECDFQVEIDENDVVIGKQVIVKS
jgi:hypothetical protein